MKEFMLWVCGLTLAIVGFSILITSPIFWGSVMFFLGMYLCFLASELTEGRK